MILELSQLHWGVFTLFSNEKPLSQSAVEAGVNRPINASLLRFGNRVVKFSVVCVRVTITSRGLLDAI